jgi:type VI secretion system protein ImpM
MVGILFPSVDRVGRYFPFTVLARLPEQASGLVVADRCAAWFERVEDLMLAQLENDGHSVDEIDEALEATSGQLESLLHALPSHLASMAPQDLAGPLTGCRHLGLGERVEIGPTALAWLGQLIGRAEPGAVFWWSSGSNSVRPSWLITRRLPEPQAFASMLSGEWGQWPWDATGEPVASGSLLDSAPAGFDSAGTTHPGHQRKENQDAYVARPEIGLWAVADGMGGHSSGHLASRAAVDALAALEARPAFPDLVRAVHQSLQDVNGYLQTLSRRAVNPTVIGTTIVVLLVRDGAGVCLWAGDSRLYRLRAGRFEQLTSDHSDPGEPGDAAAPTNVITRALGGHDVVDLEQRTFDVQAGDRFLLCSDGLYREVAADGLAALLQPGDAATSVSAMVECVLRGVAADNVTAIVVDARASAD